MSDGDVMSFGELYARSQRVAAALHDAGLRPGDGVALVLPNRPEFFEITWGCQLSGLYYTAVNTHFTPDEVAYVVDDSDAKAVFVDASMADLAAHLRGANAGVGGAHRGRRRVGGLAVLRRRRGDRGRGAAGVGRIGDVVLVGHHRSAQSRSPTAADRRQRVVGSVGAGVGADPQIRHDGRRACTCRPHRCTTRPG